MDTEIEKYDFWHKKKTKKPNQNKKPKPNQKIK